MPSIRALAGKKRRTRFRVVACVAVVAAVLAGFLPGWIKGALHEQGRLHWVGHVFVFLVLGALLNRTSRHRRVRLLLFVAAVVLGYLTEFGEHLVFGMTVEWRDVAVNGLSAAVGAALSDYGLRRKARSAQNELSQPR